MAAQPIPGSAQLGLARLGTHRPHSVRAGAKKHLLSTDDACLDNAIMEKALPLSLLLLSFSGAAALAACSDPGTSTGTGGSSSSGGASGSGGQSGDGTVPSDTSQAGIEAFLAAGTYKNAPWVGDAAPRAMMGSTSPHGHVQVFYNPAAVSSRNDGQNDYGDDPGNALGSMAVKELYSVGGELQGHAVMLRTAVSGPSNTNPNDWIYYCNSSTSTCTGQTESGPLYPNPTECRTCHGGTFIGPLPP